LLEWTGSKVREGGHGRVYWNGRLQLVHRLVYQELVGPIPEGLFVLHHCDNPPCFNPAHLYAGNAKNNADDMVKRGRHKAVGYQRTKEHREIMSAARRGIQGLKGDSHGRAKLNETQIQEIICSTLSRAKLARIYDISWTHIDRIVKGKGRK